MTENMETTLNVKPTVNTTRKKTMMKQLNRISIENGCSNVSLNYLGSTLNSETWKYEFYNGLPEYSEIIEFGEITVETK